MTRTLALLSCGAALVPAAASAQVSDAGPPVVVVQGQGVVSRVPDTASVFVAIETVDGSATASQAKNNALFERMLSSLERAGIARSSVQSGGYDLRYVPPPEPTPGPDGELRQTLSVERNPHPSERYGYVVNRSATITGLDPARVGVAVDAAAAAGATTVSSVQFGLRNQRDAYNAALAAAVGDADSQARALAAAGHFRIVRLQRLEAGSAPLREPIAFRMIGTVNAAQTEISPSNVEVRANVTSTYEIAPGSQ